MSRIVKLNTQANPAFFEVFDNAGSDGVFVNVESFRQPGFTDAQTIQAALNSGLPLGFPKRTYTINRGETVINTLCHAMLCAGATWMIGNGAIVNTDASTTNFTPFMQVQGIQGFQLFGSLTIDGNRDNQTYPATAANFGRGTAAVPSAGRRENAIVEFVPATDNVTPSRDILIDGEIIVQNGYLNGLSFWQTERVEVRSVHTRNNTVNGITAEGVIKFTVDGARHFRDGVSTAYPSTTSDGDRAGVQVREIPTGTTAAQLLMPCIPSVNGFDTINVDVNIVNCTGEECQVESWFMRMCFPGRITDCFSKNNCYSRSPSASFVGAHYWMEWGVFECNNNVAIQQANNSNLGYQVPEGMVLQTWSANGNGGSPIIQYGFLGRSVLNGMRIMCGYDASNLVQNNFFRGARIYSECDVVDLYIEGTTQEAVRIENDINFNLLPPRNVTLRDCVFENVLSNFVIEINRFGGNTVVGSADGLIFDNIKVRNARTVSVGTDDHAIIDFNTTMSGYVVTASMTRLNFDCTNSLTSAPADQTGNYNGVRLRTAAGSKLKIDFTNVNNAFNPVRASGGTGGGGFSALAITGYMNTIHRCWLIDATLWTANADSFTFDIDVIGVNNELFFVTGFSTFKFGAVSAKYRVQGNALARTFPSGAGNITTADDSFFAEALWYQWGPNNDNYGSNAPSTDIYDMKRRFSTFTTLTAATPYYVGEYVIKTDDSTIWVGTNKTTAGAWSQLSS